MRSQVSMKGQTEQNRIPNVDRSYLDCTLLLAQRGQHLSFREWSAKVVQGLVRGLLLA